MLFRTHLFLYFFLRSAEALTAYDVTPIFLFSKIISRHHAYGSISNYIVWYYTFRETSTRTRCFVVFSHSIIISFLNIRKKFSKYKNRWRTRYFVFRFFFISFNFFFENRYIPWASKI